MCKVIIIGPLPPPVHGVTVAIKRVLEAQADPNCRLIHLDTSDHRDVSTIGSADLLNYWHAIKSYMLLIAYCLHYRPDAVYVPISQSLIGYLRDSVYFFIARSFSRATVVIHLHGGHFDRFYEAGNIPTKRYVDFTMGLVGRAIVLGQVFKPIFARWLAPERIDVVPNGTDALVSVDNASLRQNGTAKNITYLSSLMRTKGIIDFVKAAVICLEMNPGLSFRIAGEWWNEDPTVKEETLAVIADNHADRIEFLGLVTGRRKEELFRETDVLVLPTYYPFEGQPTVIIEAMSAACPVISTPHAAIPETVIDGVTGILVPPRSPRHIADAIMYLVDNPDVYDAMSQASYRRYRECYTSEKSNELLLQSFKASVNS